MDMLIVCLDAGMSIKAAANRVTREFVDKQQDFGLHLSIMMLEVRGGRRLRDALANLATRLRIDEARALSVLFRQSEELGTSVTQTLRVYSKEMRDLRIVRAEEKANALPIKMLLPLGAFLFPVSLIIVLVPIVIRVVSILVWLGSPAVEPSEVRMQYSPEQNCQDVRNTPRSTDADGTGKPRGDWPGIVVSA